MNESRLAQLIAAACIACGSGQRAKVPAAAPGAPRSVGTLEGVVRSGSIEAPDTIAAGWTRIMLVTPERGHNLIVLRRDSTAPAARARLRLALDTARGTPAGAVALGGPEGPLHPGDTSEVIVRLAPGRHALACLRRNEDGHRHAVEGEWHEFVVAGDSAPGDGPSHTVEITMVDFAFTGTEEWKAGRHLIRASNRGSQDHLFILRRLHDTATVRQWIDAENPGRLSDAFGGLGRLGPEETAFFAVTLPPGRYVLVCLIPDEESGRPQAELGMLREVRVQ